MLCIQPAFRLLDGGDFGLELNVHPQGAGARHEQVHQIRVEEPQRARPAVQNRDVGACAHGHVRKLERDVTAAHEDDAARQLVALQELFAGHQLLAAWDREISGSCAGRDVYVTAFQDGIAYLDARWADEPRAAMKRLDPGLGETLRTIGGHPLDDRALEPHERRPVEGDAVRANPSVA